MSRDGRDSHVAGRDQDEDGTWLGLRDAAPRLGIASAEALRRRLRRGTWLQPHRRSNRGEWEVFVPARLGGQVPPAVQAVQDVPPAVPPAELIELRERVAGLEGAVEAQRMHITDLQGERDRLLAIVEQLAVERRPERRPWPGLRSWWRRARDPNQPAGTTA